VARCRTEPLEAALRALVVRVGEHAPLALAGLGSPTQAAAVPWASLGHGLARLDTVDVVCDLGRYLHAAGSRDLLGACDRILVVTRSSLPAVRATARLLDLLRAGPLRNRIVLLVVAPGQPYAAEEIAAGCQTPLIGELPDDPRTAAVWSDGTAAGRYLSRSPLQRAARQVAEALTPPEMWAAAELVASPGAVAS
jgi:MinD-like ATPase involved in chromosome partitioning or flagellar assembly